MKISIITVAYNSANTIEDTIKSVLAQTYSNLEYILIDGASTDATMDIVQRYKENITTVVSEPDKGIYDAMNKGVKLATGDIVGILNSDDFYAHNEVLKRIVEKFQMSELEGVYADLDYVDAENTSQIVRKWRSGEYQLDAFKKGWMPPHPTFFVLNKVYKKFGSYNTTLRSAADYEFMLRVIHKENIRLGYLPEVIVKMRAGGISNASLKNRLKANREDRSAWELNGLKPGLFTLMRKPLSKIFQFLQK